MRILTPKKGANPLITLILTIFVALQWASVIASNIDHCNSGVITVRIFCYVQLATVPAVVSPVLLAPPPASKSILPKVALIPLYPPEPSSLWSRSGSYRRWAILGGYRVYRHRNMLADTLNFILGREIFPSDMPARQSYYEKGPSPLDWFQQTIDPAPAYLTLPAPPMPIPDARDLTYRLEYNRTPLAIQPSNLDTTVFAVQIRLGPSVLDYLRVPGRRHRNRGQPRLAPLNSPGHATEDPAYETDVFGPVGSHGQSAHFFTSSF